MPVFHRSITTRQFQLRYIDAAYNLAGVTRTKQTSEVQAAINAAPTVDQVAKDLAYRSFEATDAEQFVEDALTEIQRAHAADALRAAYSKCIQQATLDSIPRVLEEAATELSPAFNKLVSEFATAAKALDINDPLSAEAAIETNTAKQLKVARTALEALGVYANMHEQHTPDKAPAILMSVLSILSLPKCTVEQVVRTPATPKPVVNAHQLVGTYAVRQFTKDAGKDMDKALIGVAAGRYEGVSFALASRDGYQERVQTAQAAFERVGVERESAHLTRVI